MKWLIAGAIALALAAPGVGIAAKPDTAETKKLHALFHAHWEEVARQSPEYATRRGDLRYNDKLSDRSKAARDAKDAQERQWLRRAQAIRRDRLSEQDQVSLDVFVHGRSQGVEGQAFSGWRSVLIGALWGAQSRLADLARHVPMDNALQARQLLERYAAYPRSVDDEIAQMREGLAAGWVPAQPVLERAASQLDRQLALAVDASPWFEPFKRIAADVPAAEREKLQALGREAIARDVLPALGKLRAFIAQDLRPKAPAEGALRNYPQGDRVYEYLVRVNTTTTLTAREVHDIGLRELAAIRGEMEGVMREVKFEGGFPQFVQHLNTDPKYFHVDGESLLAGYRSIAKRIDEELPRYFAELPRAPYGVRAMPAFRGPDAAEYYDRPTEDGSRPGWFNANALAFKRRAKWSMASLTAHEAVPGHHLQSARATELRGLPPFRRNAWYVVYGEGWALYAEALAREMGVYEDPYSLFGHLQMRAFRAARLVVDTGIHSMGWTRQHAIDFMTDRTGMNRDFMTSEVDRYTSMPGQALGYMMGALKFQELRDKAKGQLGPKFDVRRFHNVVLDTGPLPMDVLEKVVDRWVAGGGR